MSLRIETKRLQIRLYQDSDKPDFVRLVTDPEVMKFVDQGVVTRQKAESMWENVVIGNPQHNFRWCVAVRKSQEYVGHGMLNSFPGDEDEFEFGYIIAKTMWNRGFGGELAEALIGYAKNTLGKKILYATVDIENEYSIRILKRQGFHFKSVETDDKGPYHVYVCKFD